jgi:hypothetical protein
MPRFRKGQLSTKTDFEYAIYWEYLRAEYFRIKGNQSKSDECQSRIKELEWRYATRFGGYEVDTSSNNN